VHVIATAGHVDHGKSTLIRALTGMEPDRLAEEHRRGMTIDLGYAWATLPGGTQVAFVDVPGHQRFVTNMLAGVGPVPAVLFVIAADEGWCKQTGEHLEALDAFGVQHGVLAITRADLGDAELAEAEAREYLTGSSLVNMPAVAVSPVTGFGLAPLRAALERMTSALPAPADKPARLWIDRVFTVRGAGTVVTGTLGTGSISNGDQLQVFPTGQLIRVRAMEVLKTSVATASAVSRVALNLRGIKPTDLHRGDAIVAPGMWARVAVMDVRLVSSADKLPSQLMLHFGSAAVPVRVRPLGADTARLTLATPIPAHVGERAVLRDPGAQRVVAGVIVLDALPPPLRRRGAAQRRAAEVAGMTGVPDVADEVRRRGFVSQSQLISAGIQSTGAEPPKDAVIARDWLIATTQWDAWSRELLAAVDSWAAAHPLQPGLPRRAAVQQVGLPDATILDFLVRKLPDLALDGDGLHRHYAQATLPPAIERELDRLVARLRGDLFAAADSSELAAAGLTEKYMAAAVKEGRLVQVGKGIYLLPAALDEALRRLAELPQPFTMSEARQALVTTRRVAVPLLELLDRTRRTYRVDAQLRAVRS
jgi:selenocysteine-specific elongation factor